MQLFTNTGLLTITLDTGQDLTNATVTKILYKKPNGETGEWNASKSDTAITYDVSNKDIDIPGTWQFQAYVEIGGEMGRGEIVTQTFNKPL